MGDLPAAPEVERIRVSFPDDVKALAIHTDVFDGFLRYLAAILDDDGVLPAQSFWALVAGLRRRARGRPPGAGRAAAAYDLLRPSSGTRGLNRLQLRNTLQMVDLRTRPVADLRGHPGQPVRPVPDLVTISRDSCGIPHGVAGSCSNWPRQGRARGRPRLAARDRAAARRGPDRRPARGGWGRVGHVRPPGPDQRDREAGVRGLRTRKPGQFVDVVRRGRARRPAHGAVRRVRPAGPAPGEWQPWTPLAIFLVQHVLFGSYPGTKCGAAVCEPCRPTRRRCCSATTPTPAAATPSRSADPLTASGFPIIGGDPHRLFEAPSVYAQVRLSCPEFDVVGLAFPGVPGVQHFGHAGTSRGRSPTRWPTSTRSSRCRSRRASRPGSLLWSATRIPSRSLFPPRRVGPALLVDGDTALCLHRSVVRRGLDARRGAAAAPCPVRRGRRCRPRALGRAGQQRARRRPERAHVAPGGGPAAGEAAAHRGPARWVGHRRTTEPTPDFDVLGDRFVPPTALRLRCAPGRHDRVDDRRPLPRCAATTPRPRPAPRRSRPSILRPRASPTATRCSLWDRRLDATSTEAALYVRVRDRLVLAIADAEPLAALADPAAYGEMWVPWLWLPGRIASTLVGWLAADRATRHRRRLPARGGARRRCRRRGVGRAALLHCPACADRPRRRAPPSTPVSPGADCPGTPTVWPRPARSRGCPAA